MIYIKINDTLYPASINGKMIDKDWDGRESKSITLEMDFSSAVNLFTDGVKWAIVQEEEVMIEEVIYKLDENGEIIIDEEGNPIIEETLSTPTIQNVEFDNSEFNVAGDITDHRDGTITVKMGKLTDLEEAYEIMLGGIE